MLVVCTGVANADSIGVQVNGEVLSFDVPPVIDQGRTLVPLRAIFEKLGAEIEWDAETKTITAVKESTEITLQIGEKNATCDGKVVVLDVPAKIVNGRSMVPVRFVSEAMNSVVDWDGATRTVVIRSANVMLRTIETDKTWTMEEGPYIITSKFSLKSSATLTMEPGVEVYIEPEVLELKGTIVAEGTSDNPIKFIGRSGTHKEMFFRGKNNIFENCIVNSYMRFDKATSTRVTNCQLGMVQLSNSNNVTVEKLYS